jgi:hypothetical protein
VVRPLVGRHGDHQAGGFDHDEHDHHGADDDVLPVRRLLTSIT